MSLTVFLSIRSLCLHKAIPFTTTKAESSRNDLNIHFHDNIADEFEDDDNVDQHV